MFDLIRMRMQKLNSPALAGVVSGIIVTAAFLVVIAGIVFTYYRSDDPEALSHLMASLLWAAVGFVFVITIGCASLFVVWHSKIGSYRKKVSIALKEHLIGLDTSAPDWGDKIAHVARVESQANDATKENREDRIVAYSKFAIDYEPKDIDAALEALALQGHESPHVVLTATHLGVVAILSKHREDDDNEQEWNAINAHVFEYPEDINHVEIALSRGIKELASVVEFINDKKANTVTPLGEGYL